jgi:hypothetical protein
LVRVRVRIRARVRVRVRREVTRSGYFCVENGHRAALTQKERNEYHKRINTSAFDKKKTRQDKTRQDKTRQDKAGQDKTRQHKTTQSKTRQDKTRQPHNKTKRNTRQDKARSDDRSDFCVMPTDQKTKKKEERKKPHAIPLYLYYNTSILLRQWFCSPSASWVRGAAGPGPGL